jgi:hypothetical protein
MPLHPAHTCPSSASLRPRNNSQPGLRQPAQDDRPVPGQAVLVHGVSTQDRLAVVAAYDSYTSWCAKEGAPDRVDAGGANVKALIVLHCGFLRFLRCAIIGKYEAISDRLESVLEVDQRPAQ